MSIEVGTEVIGLEQVRDRFGNTSQIRRDTARVLNEAARIGAQSARIYAPKRSGALASHIKDDSVRFTIADERIEARFGVERVFTRGAGGRFTSGSQIYPLFVHEGTGLFGHLNRLITPRRGEYMVFLGRTGLIRTQSTRGQRPQPYMTEAFEDARAYIEAHLDDMVERLID